MGIPALKLSCPRQRGKGPDSAAAEAGGMWRRPHSGPPAMLATMGAQAAIVSAPLILFPPFSGRRTPERTEPREVLIYEEISIGRLCFGR